MTVSSFEKQVSIWAARRQQLGDDAVGCKGEDCGGQATRIVSWLARWLPEGNSRVHGLDFGCGWGRFTAFLAARCEHLWAVDVFQDWVDRTAKTINVTPVCLSKAKLPMSDESMELVVDLQTLQSLDDALLIGYSKELQRVAAPGATVISLHLVKPEPIRAPGRRAELLGLETGYDVIETDAIDNSKQPYTFLIGVRD